MVKVTPINIDIEYIIKRGLHPRKKSEKVDSQSVRKEKAKITLDKFNENTNNQSTVQSDKSGSDIKDLYNKHKNDPNTLHEIIRQMEIDCEGKEYNDPKKVECQTNVKILKSLASNTNIDYTLATILGEVDNLYGKNSIKPPRAPSVVTKRTKVTESLYPEPLKTSLYSYDDDTEQNIEEVKANKTKIENYGKFKKSLREIKNMHEQYEDATNDKNDYILKIIKCNKYLIEEIKHRNTKQFQEDINKKEEEEKENKEGKIKEDKNKDEQEEKAKKEAVNLLFIKKENDKNISNVKNQMYFYKELKEEKENEKEKKDDIDNAFEAAAKKDTNKAPKNEAFAAVYDKIIQENINANSKPGNNEEQVHYQVNPLFIDQPYYKKYETKEENGGTVFNFFNAEGALALFANTNIKYLLDMYYDEDNKAHPGYQITKTVKETRRTNIDENKYK